MSGAGSHSPSSITFLIPGPEALSLARRPRAPLQQCVRIEAGDERVGGKKCVKPLLADDRLQVQDLIRGEQVLRLEREVRVGEDEVRAHTIGERSGALAQFVRDYGQSIVGLIGVSVRFLALVALPRAHPSISD